jgi:DNA repair exonuclease SbcCD ATPase subunit
MSVRDELLKMIYDMKAQQDETLAITTCPVCGCETASSTELRVNKKVAELQAQLDEANKTIHKYRYGKSKP